MTLHVIVVGVARSADAWSFALAPVDPRDQGDILARLAKAVLGEGDLTDLVDVSGLETATSAQARSTRASIRSDFRSRARFRRGISPCRGASNWTMSGASICEATSMSP